MSLSRILNEDPSPSPAIPKPSFSPPTLNDLSRSEHSPEPRPHRQQRPTHPSSASYERSQWDTPYSYKHQDPVQDHSFGRGWGSGDSRLAQSPDEPLRSQTSEGYDVQPQLKRNKPLPTDADYQPTSQKRFRPSLPQTEGPADSSYPQHAQGRLEPQPRQNSYRDEEPLLPSSDLDDCEELWAEELTEYIKASQRRLHFVEKKFNDRTKDQATLTAERMSRYYAAKIANIPPNSPIPPGPVLKPNGSAYNGYTYQRSGSRIHRGEEDHDFEDAASGTPRHLDSGKRPASGALSDASSDFEIPTKKSKKRKIDDETDSTSMGQESMSRNDTYLSSSAKGKGKAKIPFLPADDPKTPRKKPGPKKKVPLGEPEVFTSSQPPSVYDLTPSFSRPASPNPSSTQFVFELDEEVPPIKKAKKMDENAMAKRVKALEEAQRKVWMALTRRDVAKAYKYHLLGYQARQAQADRVAKFASLQARRPFTKTPKSLKDTQAKAKRLMREMQVFWKKNEREERDVRKREHKEAMDRLKHEDEKREAARQARKLEFLISQTELYSHFVGNKLKTAEMESEQDDEGRDTTLGVPPGAEDTDLDATTLQDIDFDAEDKANLYQHARHNAEEAIALAKKQAEVFDAQAAQERKTNERKAKYNTLTKDLYRPNPPAPTAPLVDLDSDELNFQNPTSLSGQLTVKQPKMLRAQLKEYQLKGLNWLATLYEQGINGILADEMGLGKTVQSISLLSHLAETHDIWGPFLVVAPSSTLHNWHQEFARFTPNIKALPYWGNVRDRGILRKFWGRKDLAYNRDTRFHVVITSYNLITQDQQYFQRVKWQYMVLDEAQNIKNASSVRWKTLLDLQCRNRLLLTGTPIQNSMQELWALLHFIMPSLFDSHDEFNEWFSKDIENAAENKGNHLNEHQLRRLHVILKPFMLRRVKRHVQNELSDKIEKDIFVDLSAPQRSLYRALLSKISITDLLARVANAGDAESARSLMNLVMQFRKVCNHPQLFERADVVAPFSFTHFGQSGPLNREGDFLDLPYSTRNPIDFHVPRLLYEEGGISDVPSRTSAFATPLNQLFNIWQSDWIHRSIYDDGSSAFAFLKLMGVTGQDAHVLHRSPLIRRQLIALKLVETSLSRSQSTGEADPSLMPRIVPPWDAASGLPDLRSIASSAWSESCLSRRGLKMFIPSVVAPTIRMSCTDRTFTDRQANWLDGPLESLALYGLPASVRESEYAAKDFDLLFPSLPPTGILANSSLDQIPTSPMQLPEAKRLITDSAKLARLDTLLQELKAGDHRVLIYFQMTRMMDLMEEYLIYRQYKYLRLDGSSKIEDRRDMVNDWQSKPDIFVFLLSTRAGGLGINLTAADTVVFYDHDWNPSNDAQAMDRAHRLGQTRQVTVYRLITRGTIDERIIQLARVKKDVQDIVVGNKTLADVAKPSDIVQLLLKDEQLAGLEPSVGMAPSASTLITNEPIRDLWMDEGDDFFGQPAPSQPAVTAPGPAAGTSGGNETAPPVARKRKPGRPGRKPAAPK